MIFQGSFTFFCFCISYVVYILEKKRHNLWSINDGAARNPPQWILAGYMTKINLVVFSALLGYTTDMLIFAEKCEVFLLRGFQAAPSLTNHSIYQENKNKHKSVLQKSISYRFLLSRKTRPAY